MTQFDINAIIDPVLSLSDNVGAKTFPTAGDIAVVGRNLLSSTSGTSTLTFDLANGTDGQLIIGGGADPGWATVTSTNNSIDFTTGANTLDFATGPAVALSFLTDDTNSAVPAIGVLTVAGDNNIRTSSTGSTVTIHFDGILPVASGGTGQNTLLDHGVLIGNGTDPVTVSAVGTDGQVLIGSAGADPAFATLTSLDNSIVYATGANTLDLTVDVAAAGGVKTLSGFSGGAIPPTAGGDIGIAGGTNITTAGTANTITVNLDAAISLATSVTSPLYTVAAGDLILNMADDAGTDSVSFTNDSDVEVAYIDSLGASSFTELDVDNLNLDGNTIISTNTNGDITLTPDGAGLVNIGYLTQYHLPIIGASGSLNDLADGLGTATQVLTSNGAGAEPTWEDAGGGGGGITWNEETGTSATMAVNNGYIANNAGLVTLTLPTTAAVGDVVRVAGSGAGGWAVAQNASEIIHFGSTDSTTGVGGSLASTVRYDAVELLCIVANTEWSVISSLGNITIV